MINKTLLPTQLCAQDFKAVLDSWNIPARLIENASGEPSRYVVFDGETLTLSQIRYLDATFAPVYCRVDVFDIRFMEELK